MEEIENEKNDSTYSFISLPYNGMRKKGEGFYSNKS
jgi:hypothetical protein